MTIQSFYPRFARWILLAAICLLPVGMSGALEALRNGNNEVRQWLPAGFQETREYDWFLETFGSEEMVLVSWPGATLEDERLNRLALALADQEAVSPESAESRFSWKANGANAVQAEEPTSASNSASAIASGMASPGESHRDSRMLFRQVLTGPQLLHDLMTGPAGLSREQALSRLEGSLIGPDRQSAALLALVDKAGAGDRHAAVEAIYRTAENEIGVERSDLRIGGPTVDSVSLDTESDRSRLMLTALSVVAALLLAWWCLRDVRMVLMVFATAILCGINSVALVHFTGGNMNVVLALMPTLVYVLAISASIHLANYYRDAMREGDAETAPLRAVQSGWLPCSLAAFTTAIGLGSLGVSEVVPVKMFGLYSAAGVLCSLPVLFLFLPALMQIWPVPPASARRSSSSRGASPDSRWPSSTENHWSRGLTFGVTRYRRWILVGTLLTMGYFASVLPQINTSVKLLNLFSPQSRIIQDYTWLEHHVGPLVPIEVVLQFSPDHPLRMVDRLELVTHVQDALQQFDQVGGVLSAATFTAPLPEGDGFRNLVQKRVIDERLQRNRDLLVDAHYLRETEEAQLWRISARAEAVNELDYGQFIEQLKSEIDPIVADWSAASGQDISTIYTGVVPLIYKAQRELLNDLTSSFFTAFLLIGIVLMIMLRSVAAGLLAMLPSVFPAVVIFGGMSWAGILVDIGSMMTASLALGIAVDDTVHFLSWFRRGIQRGQSRTASIRTAYNRCAGAMMQTTVICGIGLLVFAFSSFIPTARFAWLMLFLLIAALIGDLIFLPALLASRWGVYFERARNRISRRLPEQNELRSKWHVPLTETVTVSAIERVPLPEAVDSGDRTEPFRSDHTSSQI